MAAQDAHDTPVLRTLASARRPLEELIEAAVESVRFGRRNMSTIAALALVSYPVYWLFYSYFYPTAYENLPLRIVAALVTVPVMLHARWPGRWRRWLPLYWCIGLTYCLPFFFTYMLLQNALHGDGSAPQLIWPMSHVMSIMVLIMLAGDLRLAVPLYVTGNVLAWLVLLATESRIDLSALVSDYFGPMVVYLFVLIAGGVAARRRETILQEMLAAVSSVGRSIAHELRTPLMAIRMGAQGMDRYLPRLLEAYDQALAAGLVAQPIRAAQLQALRDVADRIAAETHHSNTIIDMLLVNASSRRMSNSEFAECSIAECVQKALDRYPFPTDNERLLVHVAIEQDFRFFGSDLMLTHALFNLLKNALYFIAETGRGEIYLYTELDDGPEPANRLIFLDTARGIAADRLPYIFDRFYTSQASGRGSGIGLAFCRMVMDGMNGSIHCESVDGEYTRFVLTFPRLRNA